MSSPEGAAPPPDVMGGQLVCMIGPPSDPARDAEAVRTLLAFPGTKAVCGGTTAALVARGLEVEIRVRLDTGVQGLPPVGELPGIDLVCEGIITLSRVLELLSADNHETAAEMTDDTAARESGAAHLYRLLCRAETIKILFGQAENPNHQAPRAGAMSKRALVEELYRRLLERGKNVTIEIF